MSKASIVVDFAYKRSGKTAALGNVLKYFQYRDRVQNALATHRHYERWQDRGMGITWSDILKKSTQLESKHVLAWTWVVSPAPDLMAHVPDALRRDFVCELTERVVEEYYEARDFDLPEYSYVLHDRETNDDNMQQLHIHVVLPGTVNSIAGRVPVYNNTERGHDALFRQIATDHFETMLDETIGVDWRQQRAQQLALDSPLTPARNPHNLDDWFGKR